MTVWPLPVLVADLRALHLIVANEAADRLEAQQREIAELRGGVEEVPPAPPPNEGRPLGGQALKRWKERHP